MNLQQRLPNHRANGRSAAPAALCVGLVLALGWQPGNAATMGSVATSLGFFVALAALDLVGAVVLWVLLRGKKSA